jgi:tetratricopeptide (TPR) repeat protein
MVNLPRPRQLAFLFLILALLSSGCSKNNAPTKDQLLSSANEHFAADQYDKAAADYRSVLRLDPADAAATRQLGFISYDQGQLPQAYALLRKASELQPDNLEIQVKLATTYFGTHQFKEARDVALAILDKQPGNQEALLLLVNTSGPLGDRDDIESMIQAYREKDTDRTGYHLALAELARSKDDQARAESEYKAALALDPKSSAAYFALGNLYWSHKDLKQADEALKTASDLASQRSAMRLAYADFKRQTASVAEAKSILEDLSQKIPDALPPRVYLMKIACGEKQPDCPARVKAILTEDPLNYDGLFVSGSLSLANNEGAQAVRTFEQLTRIYSGVPLVRYQLALAYLLNGQDSAMDKAVESLNVALRLEPRFDQASVLLAQLRVRKQQFAAAIDLLDQVIKNQPQLPQARFLLASTYLAQQNQDQALAVYRQMAELFPKDPEPPLRIGTILAAQRKLPAARQSFERSSEISPDYLPAAEMLVDLDIAEKQYAAAMDRVQAQIAKKPATAQLLGIRAKVYIAQQDFPHAEADLLKAIDLDPKLERAYILLAQVYVASNRQEQAIEKLNAFVETNKDIPSLMLLGAIHEQSKQFGAAGEAYEKVLAVNRNFFPALNNLAYLDVERLARLDAAYDLAKRARALAPNDPSTADTLGWILVKKGAYGDALPFLQESAVNLPANPDVQFHLGLAYYLRGEDGPARLALQKALDAGKDFEGKDESNRRLAVLAIDPQTADAAARAKLEDYLRQSPNDPMALDRLAQLQQRDGAMDQAVKSYEKVIEGYPQFTPALRQLALLSAQRSADDQKTYDLVVKARLAYPDDSELAKTLGILNYRRRSYARSAELLQLAGNQRKNDSELTYYLGMSYYQLKQFDQAKEILQQALTMNPSPEFAAEAQRALADCCQSAE